MIKKEACLCETNLENQKSNECNQPNTKYSSKENSLNEEIETLSFWPQIIIMD